MNKSVGFDMILVWQSEINLVQLSQSRELDVRYYMDIFINN